MSIDPDRTDPVGRRRSTVADLGVGTAGAMELARGVATSGGAALLLYQLLTTQIADVRADVREVAADVDGLRGEVAALRTDVVRLQVQTARP